MTEQVDPDDDAGWVERLRTPGPIGDAALRRLHQLLLRAARYQVTRMAEAQRLGGVRLEEIVDAAADEAAVSVLRRLDDFEGRSKFTTWAYKFGILQTATEVRRAAWVHRELELELLADQASSSPTPAEIVESSELSREVTQAVHRSLTPHQRRVALVVLVDGVPIDVLAGRLGKNRNALYETLHDGPRRGVLVRNPDRRAAPRGGRSAPPA
jgi:RNA polymerase sigma-70 factor (ECF subfamily)